MAKRKRLAPASLPAAPDAPAQSGPASEAGLEAAPPVMPPIAQVAGASAAFSAARDLEAEMRAQGRLVLSLPLETIHEAHLMRDRMGVDPQQMEALKISLAAHGQRTPIEVEDLGQRRFGLISGWRRLTALRALHMETGEARFAKVLALLRSPGDRADAYIAMVEENEIRAGLSHYERARVAARAAGQGAFESPEAAVDALFASGSRARRSKIRAFLRIHEALDDVLGFPTALPERLGLKLADALKAGQGPDLRAGLTASPAASAEAEALLLGRLISGNNEARNTAMSESDKSKDTILERDGLKVVAKPTKQGFSLSFSGPAATPEMMQNLLALARQSSTQASKQG